MQGEPCMLLGDNVVSTPHPSIQTVTPAKFEGISSIACKDRPGCPWRGSSLAADNPGPRMTSHGMA